MNNLKSVIMGLLSIIDTDEAFSDYENLRCDKDFYYIYKHLSFDQYFKVLEIFTECHLRFTPPARFNDPYDCVAVTKIEGNNPTDLPQKALTEKLAVTCFNNNPLSILMWSHYAQSHQGFVIEFRIPHPFIYGPAPDALTLLKVIYTDKFPQTVLPPVPFAPWSNNFFKIMNQMVKNQFLTKSIEWKYEEEFRVLKHDYDPNNENSLLVKFPPLSIASVILGAKLNSDDEKYNRLLSAINQYNILNKCKLPVYQAQLQPNSFKLAVSDHPRLSKEAFTIRHFEESLRM
ncbi:DUF2971 domain-containing protein [Acinetobacter guillouiae]|uniref:DUF2971 domain-containing protein n=1 Tax=Acinetobacter TaxID=469 RepID=UPI001FB87B2B|nr:DUF2971 domain-containing protein [Acinetobacter sp. NyZ410]UOH19509.1 DUF2971 domain-containing protein [Acinetobacter sp. NyZ410]